MHSPDDVIAQIREAFGRTPSPGAAFLAGSREGSEPEEVARAFAPFDRWNQPDAATLDRHYDALSFLSEGGFRFFLPAYLIADLQGALMTADPVLHLTHGFSDRTVRLPFGRKTFVKTIGGSELLNPRRWTPTGATVLHTHRTTKRSRRTSHERPRSSTHCRTLMEGRGARILPDRMLPDHRLRG